MTVTTLQELMNSLRETEYETAGVGCEYCHDLALRAENADVLAQQTGDYMVVAVPAFGFAGRGNYDAVCSMLDSLRESGTAEIKRGDA